MAERKTPEQYLQEPYARTLIPDSESGGYAAQIEEFPGCFAEGETIEEAHRNLEEAAINWLHAALDLGQEIPEPFVNRTYNGNIALRLPKYLHGLVARAAEREGTSLNQFLVATIAEKVGSAVTTTPKHQRMVVLSSVRNPLAETLMMDFFPVTTVNFSQEILKLDGFIWSDLSTGSDVAPDTLRDAHMHSRTRHHGR